MTTSSQNLLLPIQQLFSNLGLVGSGYQVWTYQSGTTTPLTTYSDKSLTIPNTNPLVTDSTGRFTTQAWVANKNIVKIVLKDNNGVTIQTIDPVDNYLNNTSNTFNPIPAVYLGTTGGTSTAYTLNPSTIDISQVGYSSTDVFIITFNQICGNSPTLSIDGLSALSLVKYTGQGTTTPLLAGDIQNQDYFVKISGSNLIILNSSNNSLYGGYNTLQITGGVASLINGSFNFGLLTEGGAGSDDLDTINGGRKGQVIKISTGNSNTVVVKTGTGNIFTANNKDYSLVSSPISYIELVNDGTYWREQNRSSATSFFTVSNGASGYSIDPSGRIEQWGTGSTNNVVTFPIAFPTAVEDIQITQNQISNVTIYAFTSVSTSQFTSQGWNYDGISATGRGFNWIAKGY